MDTKIGQFVSITGASAEVARNMLEACGGNLDLAINMQLESGGGSGAAMGGAGPSTCATSTEDPNKGMSYEEM